MNFALILLICTIVTGLMTIVDKFHFAKQADREAWLNKLFFQGRSFFPVFLLVFVLRSFVVEPFRIPSSSLEPTLLVGDFVAVNKFSYGLRFPVLDKKILDIGKPQHGDISVFAWPPNKKFDYIKRVIGLPGDQVRYHNKILTINGVEAKQHLVKHTSFLDEQGQLQSVDLIEEQLGNVKHQIYVNSKVPAFDFEITVPQGQYFMMGDNRDNSSDSRYWGFVPDKNLKGKAFLIWMSWNGVANNIRWSRIGQSIV